MNDITGSINLYEALQLYTYNQLLIETMHDQYLTTEELRFSQAQLPRGHRTWSTSGHKAPSICEAKSCQKAAAQIWSSPAGHGRPGSQLSALSKPYGYGMTNHYGP